jgi:hypothetical protein
LEIQILGLLVYFSNCCIIDEKKFRCTVQCRADQNSEALISFWSTTTLIPQNQFYRLRIDKRIIGMPTKKPIIKAFAA